MNGNAKLIWPIFALLLLLATNSRAQVSKSDTVLRSAREKAWLTFDKPYYTTGDTAWFKAYVLNAETLEASKLSQKLYTELLNDSGRVIKRLVIPVVDGTGSGDFTLDPTQFAEGNYTVRAYTNWMKNFDPASWFYATIPVNDPKSAHWLINSSLSLKPTINGVSGDLRLLLKTTSGAPLPGISMFAEINDGKRTAWQGELRTNSDGLITHSCPLPDKSSPSSFSLTLRDALDKKKTTKFPLPVNGATDLDLQFLPEGGAFTASLFCRMGFKAIKSDGSGTYVSGSVLDTSGDTVAVFASSARGIGSFPIVPKVGETYTALVALNGKQLRFDLPRPVASGVNLRVTGVTGDTLTVQVSAAGMFRKGGYCLSAVSGNKTLLASNFTLERGYYNLRFAKNGFPAGITRFILNDTTGRILNERLVFCRLNERVLVTDLSENSRALAGDSISLKLRVADVKQQPVSGVFSVSVTDDQQVHSSPGAASILSYYLLSSDLKGAIEDAGWYFERDDFERSKALDELLITQGWASYDQTFSRAKSGELRFLPENDVSVSGRLTNILKKPAAGSRVTLLSLGQDFFYRDTIADRDGRFSFQNLPLSDTSKYSIKVKNTRGRASAATIDVTEFEPADAPIKPGPAYKPWYATPDTTLINNVLQAARQRQEQRDAPPGTSGKLLNEVELKGRKTSVLFHDAFVKEYSEISEKRLIEEGGTMMLYEFLRGKLPGFGHSRSYYGIDPNKPNTSGCKIMSGPVELAVTSKRIVDIYVDGISILKVVSGEPVDVRAAMEDFVTMTRAADVKSLRVLQNPCAMYLDITTRTGSGPFIRKIPGIYVYRPLPVYFPRKFYVPKYSAATAPSRVAATVFWEANLISDENGRASFSLGGLPAGSYEIRIEGTDLQGRFLSERKRIKVSQK